MNTHPITVIGGGLAGSEAAFQIASRGVPVRLYEMRPHTPTRVHRSDLLGELVCSNSLKADTLTSAHGLLKAEMRQLNSLVLRAADACRVPAGSALAVDRDQFARYLTDAVCRHPGITLVREEVTELPSDGLGHRRQRPFDLGGVDGRHPASCGRRTVVLLRCPVAHRGRRFN